MLFSINLFLQIYIQDTVTGEVYGDGDDIEVTEGDSLGLTCVSVGGRPAPELVWRLASSNVAQGTETRMERASGDWVVTRGLEARVSAAWHEVSIRCEAEYGVVHGVGYGVGNGVGYGVGYDVGYGVGYGVG